MDTDVIIIAGGIGSRLKELTKDTPKPMLEVNGKPFVQWLIEYFSRAGFKRFILALGYQPQSFKDYFDNHDLGVEIIYNVEQGRLGTAGGVADCLKHIQSEKVVITNGDSFLNIDLAKLIEFHNAHQAKVTIAGVMVDDIGRFGGIESDAQGKIIAFREKSVNAGSGIINGGIYVMDKQVIANFGSKRPLSMEYDIFPKLIGQGLYVGGNGKREFIDIGTPESYKQAETFFKI